MENIETKQNIDIKNDILKRIRNGEVKMRSKAYFIAKVFILAFVVFVIFVLSVLLVSYTWFTLRVGGNLFLLGFGGRGFFQFFLVFPWLIFILDVILIFTLDSLLRRFRFAYHNPVLYLFLSTLLIITIFGSLINLTSFHKSMMRLAEQKYFPVSAVGGFYSNLKKSNKDQGLLRGQVISIATSSFILRNMVSELGDIMEDVEIVTPEGFNLVLIKVGDKVFVAGDIRGTQMSAYGIRKLTEEE